MSQTSPNLISRAPVVVIMGHIDHGKSTLLDYIRKSKVTASEAGGITQAVSAYEAADITFIDTPGHEAFGAMRERGAQIADLAILIVAAEDGVKPQTLEAVKAIRDAQLPFLVAVNKIDKNGANPERVKQQLAEAGVLVEGYGGNISVAEISAKTGQGVPELLELIKLAAELEELKTDPATLATGFVLETNRDPRTGVTATLIIKDGRLAAGDWVVACSDPSGGTGGEIAKLKRLANFLGQPVKELVASSPAQTTGWDDLPPVGVAFQTFRNKREAEEFAERQKMEARNKQRQVSDKHTSPHQVEIPILIKTAVAGAAEAVEREIRKVETDAVGLKLITSSVGQITENDVKLALGSEHSLILGFGVKPDRGARDLAEKFEVQIQTFDIIYKLSEWLAEEIARRTPRAEIEETRGRAKILKIFGGGKNRQVVGGAVTQGRLADGATVKIWRRETEIGRGKILELQQQKIKAKEVLQDNQFGALVETKLTLAPGDALEAFELVNK